MLLLTLDEEPKCSRKSIFLYVNTLLKVQSSVMNGTHVYSKWSFSFFGHTYITRLWGAGFSLLHKISITFSGSRTVRRSNPSWDYHLTSYYVCEWNNWIISFQLCRYWVLSRIWINLCVRNVIMLPTFLETMAPLSLQKTWTWRYSVIDFI